jgi:NADPH:quinone reductase-like Zn-dependent oxidoreductase
MKAIHLTAYGNPAQNLRMVEVSEPNAPSASEALVRMEYAPIDYSDLLLANGVYFLNPKLPSVIGGEGAGIVEAIRPGVIRVKVVLPSHLEHSPGLKKSLLQPKVFSSFLLQSMPERPRC